MCPVLFIDQISSEQLKSFKFQAQLVVTVVENQQNFELQYHFNFNILVEASDGTSAIPPMSSDQQAQTLFRNIKYIQLFTDWLMDRCPEVKRQRLNRRYLENQLQQISNQSDSDFQKSLYSLIYQRPQPQPKQNPPPNSMRRQKERVDELHQVLPKNVIISYILDIGASDGYMVQQFGESLNLPRESTFGMDIRPCLSQEITFIEQSATVLNENLLNRFDLITIAMTLHHIAQYKIVLTNALKYLKLGAYLFIREHDAFTNEYKLLLDIHDQTFNSSFWEYPESAHKEFVKNCKSWFLSRNELTTVLNSMNLKHIDTRGNYGDWNWDVHGRVYWSLWQKQ